MRRELEPPVAGARVARTGWLSHETEPATLHSMVKPKLRVGWSLGANADMLFGTYSGQGFPIPISPWMRIAQLGALYLRSIRHARRRPQVHRCPATRPAN
jgi:hypothetical protein